MEKVAAHGAEQRAGESAAEPEDATGPGPPRDRAGAGRSGCLCRARSAETGAPPGEDAGAMPKGPPRAEAARASGRLPPPRATGGASRRGRLHRCGRRPATATRPSATAAPPGRRHVADTEADPPPAKRRRRARDSEDGWRFLPIRCFFIKVQTVFVRTQRTPNGLRCSVNATSPRGGKPKHACASRGRGGPCAAASGARPTRPPCCLSALSR